MSRPWCTHIALEDHRSIVAVDSEYVLKMRVLVFWDEVLEDTLLGGISDVDTDKLVLRSILVRQEIERRAVVRDAICGISGRE